MNWVDIVMDHFLTLNIWVFIFQEDKDNYNVTSLSNTTVSYHVDVSISCCTCPVGIMGGHCKHQSAVARMFGHNSGLFQCFSPETRQLYYQIATGEFMEISRGKQMSENIQPLFVSHEQEKTFQMMVPNGFQQQC